MLSEAFTKVRPLEAPLKAPIEAPPSSLPSSLLKVKGTVKFSLRILPGGQRTIGTQGGETNETEDRRERGDGGSIYVVRSSPLAWWNRLSAFTAAVQLFSRKKIQGFVVLVQQPIAVVHYIWQQMHRHQLAVVDVLIYKRGRSHNQKHPHQKHTIVLDTQSKPNVSSKSALRNKLACLWPEKGEKLYNCEKQQQTCEVLCQAVHYGSHLRVSQTCFFDLPEG